MVVVFNNYFLFLKTKKHWKRVWEREWFLYFYIFCVLKRPIFIERKKRCFDCFLHCSENNYSPCFLLHVFCVSLHVVSPPITWNEGHGGWRWQSCWLLEAVTKTMVVLAWVNGHGCERHWWQCGALKGKATSGDAVSDDVWQ